MFFGQRDVKSTRRLITTHIFSKLLLTATVGSACFHVLFLDQAHIAIGTSFGSFRQASE